VIETLPSSHDPEPLVSIITPTYNHEGFIGNCVKSVLAQKYSNWEQIIVDDESTDGTGDVVSQLADPRIRYIRQKHKGIEALAHTYNHALCLCRGSLVAILEGDDAWPIDKLAHQVPVFRDPDVILSFGEVFNIDAEGVPARRLARSARKRRKLPYAILNNDPIGSMTAHLLSSEGQSLMEPSTVIIRREALDKIGGFQYAPGGCPTDIPTFTTLSVLGRFQYIPILLGHRRRHQGSATQKFVDPMWRSSREFVLSCLTRPDLGIGPDDREMIKKSWDPKSASREFAVGRICSLHQQWAEARRHFVRALDPGEPRAACGAALGWILTWIHTDLEGVFRLAGRTSMKRIAVDGAQR
jgi:glycosyltransferase involved in cell wall biosynthesis